MKKLLIWAMSLALVVAFAGCSDDDTVVGGDTPPDNTNTSTWNAEGGYWSTIVDGSDYDNFRGFSFTSKDTITTGVPKVYAEVWDVAFRREIVKLNGGSSSENEGDVMGADLGVVDFAGVTMADTVGADWSSDEIEYFINDHFFRST